MHVLKVVLTLPRKDPQSYKHIAHVRLTDEEPDELRMQHDELKEEFPDLAVVY